jgi:hypothetical protein
MRKLIIAGLTLSTAVGLCAGQAMAVNNKDGVSSPAHRRHEVRKPPRVAETPAPVPYFRLPAHPLVWDCVHVMFPQCSRGWEPLNDGTRGRY